MQELPPLSENSLTLSSPLSPSPPAAFLTSNQHSEETQVTISWNSGPPKQAPAMDAILLLGLWNQTTLKPSHQREPHFRALRAMHRLIAAINFRRISSVGPLKAAPSLAFLCSCLDGRSLLHQSSVARKSQSQVTWLGVGAPCMQPMTDLGR